MNETPQNQPPAGTPTGPTPTGPTPIDRLTLPIPPTGHFTAQPFVQYQSHGYAPFPTYPQPPRRPSPTLGQRVAKAAESGLIGKILAGVGVAITLSGIVMLLVLAAQAGLLRPEIRVAGGGILAAVLAGLGVWTGRIPERRPGAVALVATGIAGLLFDVLAMSTIYGWLPEIAALAVAGLIAGVGLGVAHRWNSQTLTLMVSIPMLVLSPVVTRGVDEALIGFLLVYAAASLWIQVGRSWLAVFVVNTAAVMFPSLIFTQISDQPWLANGFALTAIAIAIGSSLLLVRSANHPEVVALTSGFAAAPLLFAAGSLGAAAFAVLAAGSAMYLVAAFSTTRFVTRDARVMWLATAIVHLLVTAGYVLDADYRPSAIMTIGLLLAVAAPFAGDLALVVRVAGTAFSGIGVLALTGSGALHQLFSAHLQADDGTHASLLVGGLMGLAATALVTWSWADLYPESAHQLTVAGSAVGLWLITTVALASAHLTTSDADTAFRAGHAAATITWGIAAAAALLWARRLAGADRAVVLTAGLAVMAAAIAKLFLFDLAALDGIFRVIAFIVVGLILLALGVSYAQKLGEAEPSETTPQARPAA
ncbi:DUF2339 domain-containing protein [Gordonia sp. HY002]|uniref:DUF2339 domain-containing protein n=1 Tax=Gordonia zhenghanii TaxID=2911516 RepID=UPI001EEFE215|nr:DUF2339 domain-containing protein [Gordonia zhenghanii]MCF8570968.1 DUF2339 domain-containing protein [Gordonia zhenghanii]MCF8604711.1 DUF2339 domain-containing protein [Gordonia zhenghanii]